MLFNEDKNIQTYNILYLNNILHVSILLYTIFLYFNYFKVGLLQG